MRRAIDMATYTGTIIDHDGSGSVHVALRCVVRGWIDLIRRVYTSR